MKPVWAYKSDLDPQNPTLQQFLFSDSRNYFLFPFGVPKMVWVIYSKIRQFKNFYVFFSIINVMYGASIAKIEIKTFAVLHLISFSVVTL